MVNASQPPRAADRPTGGGAPDAAALGRIASVLLAALVIALGVGLFCAIGWWRAAQAPVMLERLSADQRRTLVADLMTASPGIYERAWFAPEIGFVLRREQMIEAWGDRFRANALGYRSLPVPAPDADEGDDSRSAEPPFRLLVVGDSWAYGMGVTRREAYPARLAALINDHAGLDRPIEVHTVALPGYNVFNQMAALWFAWPSLRPDAVVFAPSSNDHHTALDVLPNGASFRPDGVPDRFGDPHGLIFRVPRIDSHRVDARVAQMFAALRASEARLEMHGVPTFFFYVARWRPPFVHAGMRDAGLRSPYAIVPVRYTLGAWLNDSRWGHGNADAHALYARLLYPALANHLGWQQADDRVEGAPARAAAALAEIAASDETLAFAAPPDDAQWRVAAATLRQRHTQRDIAPRFDHDDPAHLDQVAGPFDATQGAIGAGTTVLVRRARAATALEITLARLDGFPTLYPLPVRLAVPSAAGGTRVDVVLRADGPDVQRFVLPLPDDVPAGHALDVRVLPARTAGSLAPLTQRSLRLLGIRLLHGESGD